MEARGPMESWSVGQVCEYFLKLGIEDVSAFEREGISGSELMRQEEHELAEFDVPRRIRREHRRRKAV